jgi:hypothetical protein
VTRIQELLEGAAGPAGPGFSSVDVGKRVRRRERRRRWAITSATVVLAAVLTGWVLQVGNDRPPVAAVTEPGPATPVDVVGSWVLDGVSAVAATPGDPFRGGTVDLLTSGGFVLDLTGCGGYRGTWTLDGTQLTVTIDPHTAQRCPGSAGAFQEAIMSRLAEPLTVLATINDPTTIALRASTGLIVLRRPGAPIPQPTFGGTTTTSTTLPPPAVPMTVIGAAVRGSVVHLSVSGLDAVRGQEVDIALPMIDRYSGVPTDFLIGGGHVDEGGHLDVDLSVPDAVAVADDLTFVPLGERTLFFMRKDKKAIGAGSIEVVAAQSGVAYAAFLTPAQCGNPRFVSFDGRAWLPDESGVIGAPPDPFGDRVRGSFTVVSERTARFVTADQVDHAFTLSDQDGYSC